MNHTEKHLIRPDSCRCMFCSQFAITGWHARACPGKASDIRTWTEIHTDRDGNAVGKDQGDTA